MNEKQYLDGALFSEMLKNGLRMLKRQEKEINRLNVFPVSDGDTGINMRLTLENGLNRAEGSKELGAYSASLADGMLLSARGNSGVILSQLFRGIAESFEDLKRTDGEGMLKALENAYQTAYATVIHPVEGTILTVAREGASRTMQQLGEVPDLDEVTGAYLSIMQEELIRTPELLPVLKEAGVVDSGAMGLIAIFDGMDRYLRGELLEDGEESAFAPAAPVLDLSLFNEDSEFIDGYCMEFLLQRMNAEEYEKDFDPEAFNAALTELGNSIVCVPSGKRVKVHIHTKDPSPVIALARKYGEFLTFKLENMQIQHNEHDLETEVRSVAEDNRILNAEKKPLAVIAVANGEGIMQIYRDLGCDLVIDGGTTMNTSTEEFLQAFGRVNADAIAVLANNKNVILAAEQARELSRRSDIHIIPSTTLMEGYFALAMDVPDSKDTAYRLSQMRLGAESVDTVSVTASVRDYSFHGTTYPKGTLLGLMNDEILYGGPEEKESLVESLKRVPGIENREILLIFRGKDVPEEEEDALLDALYEAFPDLETEIVYGGQPVYRFLAGLS